MNIIDVPFNVLICCMNFKENTIFIVCCHKNGLKIFVSSAESFSFLLYSLRRDLYGMKLGLTPEEVNGAYFNFTMSAGDK